MEEKNIWVLPTDKPSRLHKIGNEWGLTYNANSNPFAKQKNIYITSSEEIKYNDYYLGEDGLIYCLVTTVNSNGKKIILTTDQDLIKDGLQAIDDEFLEWFVKNPSCESVEITSSQEFLGDDYRHGGEPTLVYKIIITNEELKPYLDKSIFKNVSRLVNLSNKEETKKELLKQYPLTPDKCFKQDPKQQTYIQSETFVVGMSYTSEDGSTKFVTKQKTLEEQMYKASFANESPLWHDGFIAGSKWQAERMYSEEEVLKILLDSEEYTSRFNGRTDLKKWFKHKKK
jgi:hypothetical protein